MAYICKITAVDPAEIAIYRGIIMKAMNRFIILAFTSVIVIASNTLSCFAADSNSFTRNTFVTVKVDESLIMAEGQQFASVKVVTHDIDNNRWNKSVDRNKKWRRLYRTL